MTEQKVHYYVVSAIKGDDGEFTFGVEDDVQFDPESPVYNPSTEEWERVSDERLDIAFLSEIMARLGVK